MRLVDADKARECFGGDGVTGAVMQRMFDSLPTIDAVPVVRCRECKHWLPRQGYSGCHHRRGLWEPQEDDYCSHGEREEATHEVSEP
nr:MAG TPA: baseplate protein [Caudoviricetes sp.]